MLQHTLLRTPGLHECNSWPPLPIPVLWAYLQPNQNNPLPAYIPQLSSPLWMGCCHAQPLTRSVKKHTGESMLKRVFLDPQNTLHIHFHLISWSFLEQSFWNIKQWGGTSFSFLVLHCKAEKPWRSTGLLYLLYSPIIYIYVTMKYWQIVLIGQYSGFSALFLLT